MKSSYIAAIALVLVVIGVAWFLMRDTDIANAPIVEDMDLNEDFDDSTPDDDNGVMTNDEQGGSDVGMELPETGVGMDVDLTAKVFDISGAHLAFSQKEIRVKEGDTVVINFTSTDGTHDWALDEFDAKTGRVDEGKTSSVTFVAERKGTFEYYCSVGEHRANGMVGKLIVE